MANRKVSRDGAKVSRNSKPSRSRPRSPPEKPAILASKEVHLPGHWLDGRNVVVANLQQRPDLASRLRKALNGDDFDGDPELWRRFHSLVTLRSPHLVLTCYAGDDSEGRLLGFGVLVPCNVEDHPVIGISPPDSLDTLIAGVLPLFGPGSRPSRANSNTLATVCLTIAEPETEAALAPVMLEAMRETALNLGYEYFQIPVKPAERSDYPELSMSQYARRTEPGATAYQPADLWSGPSEVWTDPIVKPGSITELPADPRLRIHAKDGGRVVGLTPDSVWFAYSALPDKVGLRSSLPHELRRRLKGHPDPLIPLSPVKDAEAQVLETLDALAIRPARTLRPPDLRTDERERELWRDFERQREVELKLRGLNQIQYAQVLDVDESVRRLTEAGAKVLVPAAPRGLGSTYRRIAYVADARGEPILLCQYQAPHGLIAPRFPQVSIDSETGRLRWAIVGDARGFNPSHPPINLTQQALYGSPNAPQRERMIWELDNYAAVLERLGVRVDRPTPRSDLLDQVTPRDIGFVIGNVFFLSNMAHWSREREWLGIRDIIKQIPDMHWVQSPPHLVTEGGDVVVHDGKAFVGLGTRTTPAGIAFIKKVMRGTGFDIVPVGLKDDALHLDCAIGFVGYNDLLIAEHVLTEVPGELSKSKYKWLGVTPEEQAELATNVQSVTPRRVITRDIAHRINDELARRGIDPYPVPFNEGPKTGGSLRCATTALLRDPLSLFRNVEEAPDTRGWRASWAIPVLSGSGFQ